MNIENRVKGAIYGFAIGDALGVPFEFSMEKNIPKFNEIDMIVSDERRTAHFETPCGTWSDDTSQMLALIDTITEHKTLDLKDFGDKMLQWRYNGDYTPDGVVFDCGNQTHAALEYFDREFPPNTCGYRANPSSIGNGALMRCIGLGLLYHTNTDVLAKFTKEQCLITHYQILNQYYSLWYNLIIGNILNDKDFTFRKFNHVLNQTKEIVLSFFDEDEISLINSNFYPELTLGGHCAPDTFYTAVESIIRTENYADAVKFAISQGDDTDTNGAVTGGLAGLIYGFDSIPQSWIASLHGKEMLDNNIEKILKFI